ncbi:hypothetical protein RhiirA4_221567 [Rhizophagus irregularis]|uniref:Uncharacterized protein n=1 Tax=Rhizophagus irregularis TaxID=588596 RepID=A0A2I1FYB4_9GLOM|nr:hypothetical protein RhiirA4_221567 [Rhizophagus irregularis]
MFNGQYNQPHQSPSAQRNNYPPYQISRQFPQTGLHNGSQYSTIGNYNNSRNVDMRYPAAAAAVGPLPGHPSQYKHGSGWGTGDINASGISSGNGSLTSSLTYGTNNTNTANNPGNFAAQANPNMFSATAQAQQPQSSRRIQQGSASMPLRLGSEAHYQQPTHQSSIGT